MPCFQQKYLIQDLLDQGVIEVDSSTGTSNIEHIIFNTSLLDHDKGKSSSSNSNKKGNLNYTNASHNNIINCFHASDECVSTIRIKEQESSCAVTTCQSKIVLKGAPSNPPKPTPMSQYNLLDHLGKIPTQILILELLKMSPMHHVVLDKALTESTIPTDIVVDQFKARIGHLATS